MNKIMAMIMVLPLAALGFVVHTCGGLLALAWMIRHPSRLWDDGYNEACLNWMENNVHRPPLLWLRKYLDLILKLFDK